MGNFFWGGQAANAAQYNNVQLKCTGPAAELHILGGTGLLWGGHIFTEIALQLGQPPDPASD